MNPVLAAAFDPTAAFSGVGDQVSATLTDAGPIVAAIVIPIALFSLIVKFVKRGAKG